MTDEARSDNPDRRQSRLIVGCGYLGRRIAARWRERGLKVFATTRGRVEELRGQGLVPIVADLLRQDSIPPLPQVTTVVQCVGFDRAARESLKDIYVVGLANVLAKLPPGGRLIYISSTGVYGAADGREVDESVRPAPPDETGEVVRQAEELLRAQRPDAIILRFAGIYGPGRLLREKALRAGQPLHTHPDKWLNLIHVEDGADAVLAAESAGRPGEVYNIADGAPVRRRDFFTFLADALGTAPPEFGSSIGESERGNRRISNRRMIEELGVKLQFPTYRDGLEAVRQTEPDVVADIPELRDG